MIKPHHAVVTALVSFGVIVACKTGQAPTGAQDQAVAQGACTALEAVTGDGLVHTLCADAPALASLVDIIAGLRAGAPDAGPRSAPACAWVGDVCATRAELARAIDIVNARKKVAR